MKAVYGAPSEILHHYKIGEEHFCARTRPKDHKVDHLTATYNSLGLEFRFHDDGGLFEIIGSNAFLTQRKFSGKTSEGICIGDHRKNVMKAYGEPTRVRGKGKSPFVVVFGQRGISFSFDEEKEDLVSAIFVKAPVVSK